ncbi:male accessory gland serine protease inhibitor [Drosophila grimshawi]|uniref:GH13183 n=1 Tax=Drosophila grimshawi TaxID=7222 RepID=B4JQI1_DROGR|nr:male accessory gland serine protease inhibitor [Drosophila grimshawi]EDV99161.1 GH13183 [Drosophila grimshawi]EDW04680.1 GH25267 [Drosophila grimshawi]
MKYFAVLLLLCSLLGATLATLKNPACGEEFGKIGNCRALQKMWSYRRDINECINFNYGGCHGNSNLFKSKSLCETTCKV